MTAIPRCLLITPARNEERNIPRTIASMTAQTLRPAKWVIVDDGSTDRTAAIVDEHSRTHPWIERFEMPAHRDRSFAAKAHCFNAAWRKFGGEDYEVIGNVDADVSFDPDYVGFLLGQFAADPDLGVAGTPFTEDSGYDSVADSFEGASHVAGGCQLFRRRCFEDVGGYVPNPAGGVDWIAVTTARMKGWKTRSFEEKRFLHHRALGTAERNPLSALYSYGEKDYYLGGSPLWEVCRVGFRLVKRPYVVGSLALGAGYVSAAVRRIDRPVTPELMRFHRQEQHRKLKAILGTILRLKKPDTFRVLPAPGKDASGSETS